MLQWSSTAKDEPTKMESSLFPDSLVANPGLLTTALAERNIERIIAQMR